MYVFTMPQKLETYRNESQTKRFPSPLVRSASIIAARVSGMAATRPSAGQVRVHLQMSLSSQDVSVAVDVQVKKLHHFHKTGKEPLS